MNKFYDTQPCYSSKRRDLCINSRATRLCVYADKDYIGRAYVYPSGSNTYCLYRFDGITIEHKANYSIGAIRSAYNWIVSQHKRIYGFR